jgi:AraC-like DNA-binding protein
MTQEGDGMEDSTVGCEQPISRGHRVAIRNYTMAERTVHADFGIRNERNALPNPAPHRHEYFQIHVQVAGATWHYIGGAKRPVSPRTLCFIQPYKAHFIPTVGGAKYYLINASKSFICPGLVVDPYDIDSVPLDVAPELALFKYQEYLDFTFEADEFAVLSQLCDAMMAEKARRGLSSTMLCRAYLHQCLGLVCRRFSSALWQLAEQHASSHTRREALACLTQFLRENFDKPVSLGDAAARVGLSPTYLAHLIKKDTGKTFLELLTERRLDCAKELIVHTSLPITDVAEQAGFSDSAYFIRRFRQLTGTSPSRFRAAAR